MQVEAKADIADEQGNPLPLQVNVGTCKIWLLAYGFMDSTDILYASI